MAKMQFPPCSIRYPSPHRNSYPLLRRSTHPFHPLYSSHPQLSFAPIYRTTLKSPTFFHDSPPLPEEYPAFRIKLVSVSSFVHPCSRATSGRYVAEYRLAWWVKDMRRPWVPRVQSSGVEQGVKAVRRVTDTERCGSSGLCMGGKRVSSYALFNVGTRRKV